jgi:hypothetical protein
MELLSGGEGLHLTTDMSAFDTGYDDGFVVKMNRAGSGLAYANFLIGNDYVTGGIASVCVCTTKVRGLAHLARRSERWQNLEI